MLPAKSQSAKICEHTPVVTNFTAPVSYNVTGLEPCAEYHFTVQAITHGGLISMITYTDNTTADDCKSISLHYYWV